MIVIKNTTTTMGFGVKVSAVSAVAATAMATATVSTAAKDQQLSSDEMNQKAKKRL